MNASLREMARDDASLSVNYAVLTIASCVIATMGLIENSVAVIIGAMVVAPLIGPIQAFAYAALAGDAVLVRRALTAAITGTLIAVATSAALGSMIALPTYGSEVLARTRPTLFDLVIAVTAGSIAGFAKLQPKITATIAGTAIAVALMPPLCVVGLSIADAQWDWARGAALLFGTNFLGIALACMIVYVVAGEIRTHSRLALITTIAVTAALMFPLGAGSYEIVRQARIESQIRNELTTNTVTFRRARLVGARFDWYSSPVSATLDVSADHPMTPGEVGDLERFVAARTSQQIQIVCRVRRYETVTDTGSSPSLESAAPQTP